jgi:hypothetical protein
MSPLPSDEALDWLTGPAARPWLQLASQLHGDVLALAARLRKALSAEQTRVVIEQAELRRRGSQKFAQAAEMFFTAIGLEQASDDVVAAYKAERFSAAPVADLCCGIGGDLIALASRLPTIGVERDRLTAAFARANLRLATRGPEADTKQDPANEAVRAIDVRSFTVADFAAWHLDPDRRPNGRRTTSVPFYEPGPQVIGQLLAKCPDAAIKLAPAAMPSDTQIGDSGLTQPVPWSEAELVCISHKRQCRQLVAWFGGLARRPGMRRATNVASSRSSTGEAPMAASFVGRPRVAMQLSKCLGRYLFEPDPAVLAAHLTGALAADLGLQQVVPGVAYLTADHACDSALLSQFDVIEQMEYRPKVLKRWLATRRIGRLEVKKRGVGIDPARVSRELAVPGDVEATLFLFPLNGRTSAVVARRVPRTFPSAAAMLGEPQAR